MKKITLLLGLMVCFTWSASALTLDVAAVCDGDPTTKSAEELAAGKVISDVYKAASVNAGTCIGWTNLGFGDIWYDVTRQLSIYSANVRSRELLGHWPLTRWPHLHRIPEILADHKGVGLKQWREKIEYTSHNPYAGCLNQHPLRYGDLEGDGESEVVLLLNGELIVFSPKYARTVFSAFAEASDWFREEGEEVSLKSDLEDDISYQYLSEHLMYNGMHHKAHRSYTKVYIGDYDEDGKPDILTWQKTYAANKVGEAAGFHLVRNEVRHFKRNLAAQQETKQGVTGEYLPQETEEATILQWLTDRELTWSKGFPSVSECSGQEGQLIPEMHDPLLNDPQVLQ